MKAVDRECQQCGGITYNTCSRSPICIACTDDNRRKKQAEKERNELTAIDGYSNITGPEMDVHKHRVWSFTHTECGTEQQWVIGNWRARRKAAPDQIPCRKCGGSRRMKNAHTYYMEKYGIREEDYESWVSYRNKCRTLTENTYRENINVLNPERLDRDMLNWHLDHIVPIKEGWERGIPPEVIAAVGNLRMMDAGGNLIKGARLTSEAHDVLAGMQDDTGNFKPVTVASGADERREARILATRNSRIAIITGLGGNGTVYVGRGKHGKDLFQYQHTLCGVTQTWGWGNFMESSNKAPGLPCGKCRMSHRT